MATSNSFNTYSIATIDVRGLNNRNQRQNVFQTLSTQNFHFYALQETHGTTDSVKIWEKEWKGQSFWSPSQTSFANRVAILINPKYSFKIDDTDIHRDSVGRIISIKVKTHQSSHFEIINIYAPTKPSARGLFFNSIPQYISHFSPLVMAGDFNMVEDPWKDKLGSRNLYSTIGLNELNQIKQEFKLSDVWRNLNPYKKQFSWSSSNQSLQSRIDRIYISNELISAKPEAKIIPFPWSDHDIVTSTITIPNTAPSGPGIHTTLLQNKNYVNYMKK